MKPGLVVVDRTPLIAAGLRRSEDKQAEALSAHYRGLEGMPWPAGRPRRTLGENDLLPESDLAIAEEYLQALMGRGSDCILISDEKRASELPFLGVDVGFFESEHSHYSVLFHEVIFGLVPEMCAQRGILNEHGLLDEREAARSLLALRLQLISAGADLETYGQLRAFLIYGRLTRRRSG